MGYVGSNTGEYGKAGKSRRSRATSNRYKGEDAVVYGPPRGGVVTARALADALDVPLDLLVACKVGHPDNPEYAFWAVSEDGYSVFNDAACASIPLDWLVLKVIRFRISCRNALATG